jgi:hypothetical protein
MVSPKASKIRNEIAATLVGYSGSTRVKKSTCHHGPMRSSIATNDIFVMFRRLDNKNVAMTMLREIEGHQKFKRILIPFRF